MSRFVKKTWLVALFLISLNFASALEQADRLAIQEIIKDYADSWNLHGGRNFAKGFTDDADFVNVFGMYFSGKEEIEHRHVQILQTFMKGSVLEILDTKLREIQPGVVIGIIRWRLEGYRNPYCETNKPPETREGIFTHVFVNIDKKWKIAASQNTRMPNNNK